MYIEKEVKANLLCFLLKREREAERETKRETEEGKEIIGEHDNISANLRIVYNFNFYKFIICMAYKCLL